MRKYELMTVFSTEEDKFKAASDAVRSVLASFGAEIEKEEVFGDRDLTYEVKKQKRGHFVLFTLKLNPAKIIELDGKFKFNNNLLKYLFVLIESKNV